MQTQRQTATCSHQPIFIFFFKQRKYAKNKLKSCTLSLRRERLMQISELVI
jgi:hypothetical protein